MSALASHLRRLAEDPVRRGCRSAAGWFHNICCRFGARKPWLQAERNIRKSNGRQDSAIFGLVTSPKRVEVLITGSQLQIDILDEGHLHPGRHQRRGAAQRRPRSTLRFEPLGIAASATRAHQVVGVDRRVEHIDEVDRAVLPGIAIVAVILAPPLDAGGDADIAGPDMEDVRARDLEVPRGKAEVSLAAINADTNDRRATAAAEAGRCSRRSGQIRVTQPPLNGL